MDGAINFYLQFELYRYKGFILLVEKLSLSNDKGLKQEKNFLDISSKNKSFHRYI